MKDAARIAVIGSGGREHALCWKLSQSAAVAAVYCLPGNGGTALADKVENVEADINDFEAIADFATRKNIDLIVIGPDNPLADGIVDYLESRGLRVFGPKKESARLEWSKAHAKQFLLESGIPTARFQTVSSLAGGESFVRENPWARVVKVDGLALGKGVFVCDDEKEALDALATIFAGGKFGPAADKVIVEEKLSGEELSLLFLCDGKTLKALAPCQDHKRRLDGDRGPNTGGMGAYSPVELYDRFEPEIERQVTGPLKEAIADGRLKYKGVLYAGLLIGRPAPSVKGHAAYRPDSTSIEPGGRDARSRRDSDGAPPVPYVLEFNARFGDPETQALLPRLESDLYPLLWSCTDGTLEEQEIIWKKDASLCVVAVGKDYPDSSSRGKEIAIGPLPGGATVFHAGTRLDGGKLVTNGGRVLAVTALGDSMDEAKARAYSALESVSFEDMDYRKDIAWRAAKCLST